MKTLLNNQKGFSLVELVVSILILSLVAIAFMSLFSSSLTTIFSRGNKDLAMSFASEIMELLYQKQEEQNGLQGNQEDIEDTVDTKIYKILDDVPGYTGTREEVVLINLFQNGSTVSGYKITITVSYQGGEVSLTSFFRGSD